MPKQWQTPTNNIVPETGRLLGTENRRRRLGTQLPIQVTNKKGGQSNKTPEKAHLDTLRRRERRQRSRAVLPEESKDLGCLKDIRFILLSETDDEEEKENSEVDILLENTTGILKKKRI